MQGDKKEYILLYRLKQFGRVVNRWEKNLYSVDNVKNWVQERADDDVSEPSPLEHLVFPAESSRLLDAYRGDRSETFFVCIKKRNGQTAWEQFNSPWAAKKYINSFGAVKEIYIFSSKDMSMRI